MFWETWTGAEWTLVLATISVLVAIVVPIGIHRRQRAHHALERQTRLNEERAEILRTVLAQLNELPGEHMGFHEYTLFTNENVEHLQLLPTGQRITEHLKHHTQPL